MSITQSSKNYRGRTSGPASLAFFVLGIFFASFISSTAVAQSATTPTTINISDNATLTNARRLGVNLGTQDSYDSGQMKRNIMFQNPGFEGEQWQSILHCKAVTATSCTDDEQYSAWPANFLQGATVEFIVGNAVGTYATVTSSTVANQAAGTGVTVTLSGLSIPPSVGDYLVARMEVPGNAQTGWWTSNSSGATLSTEFNDLSPNTPGKQALRATVPAGQSAEINSYCDGEAGWSFVQMNGTYTLTFRAKSTGGSKTMNVAVLRDVNAPPTVMYFNQDVTLTNSWQDYTYTFNAADTGRLGAIQLRFSLNGASVLLDDVALTAPASANNPTAFRDEVVSTLRKLNPGTLRYMDSGANWGSSLDNMLASDFARERPGYSNFGSTVNNIPIGLHDFLVLCQTVGAEPWYTMQAGMSVQEMSNLMDYLGGSTSTTYGAKRAAMGQTAPWTSVFKTIHLEFGNEVWNTANPGATFTDPAAYGKRSGMIFTAAKNSASYSPKSFDFVVDGFQTVPTWNQTVLENSSNYDTIDVASYIFTSFNDFSSIEKIYGPMFAEPEMQVTPASGIMNQQAVISASATTPANLAVYESNISTNGGSATQAAVNATVPSVGAGITAALNLLLAQRDLGVNNQNLFSLAGYHNGFGGALPTSATVTPVWGSVVDMGGASNLQRPNFLAEQLANSAILPKLLSTSQTGANPTWNQPLSTNDNVALPNAHYIQSVAYTDGTTLNVIAFNLSRTTALPITFAGLNAPTGAATIRTLTSAAITDNNEAGDVVDITSTSQTLKAGSTITLPPFSMTVISAAAPYIPIQIYGVTATCGRSSLSPGDTTPCTSNVTGQGNFNSGVTWTVDQGSISSTGVYSAPSTVPASGVANVTATSLQDSTKVAKFAISIAPDAVTGVTVTCSVKTLGQGQNTNCSATVAGTGSYSNAFTWSVSSGASITPAGLLTAAINGTSMTVTATSTQDTTKSGTFTLALTPVLTISNPVVKTTSTSITASWTTNMLVRNGLAYGPPGGKLLGTPYDNNQITNPSYTVTGLTPGGTYVVILTSYTAPSPNPYQAATYPVTVTLPLKDPTSTVTGVSTSCGAASILQGGNTTCAATVAGTGSFAKTVTWSVSGGSISATGTLTAPTAGTSITVTATSTQDATKSGSFVVSLTQPITVTGVAVSCGPASIVQGGTTNCAATVAGTGAFAQTVTWSASGGSISSTGALSAPTTGTSVTVTATSTQDATKSGSFLVSLTPSTAANTITGVNLNCASARNLLVLTTTTCTATAVGTGSFSPAVRFTTTAGTITSNGLLTAPAQPTIVYVNAISVQDPTKYAHFTIEVVSAITISSPVITTTPTSITATWKVNVMAHNALAYSAAGGTVTTTPTNNTLNQTPSYTVTGLTPGTTYNLVLNSYVAGPDNVQIAITVNTPKK
jgi:alpha-L-arabinofuranosidase